MMSDVVGSAAELSRAAIAKAEARAKIDRWLAEYSEGTTNRRGEAVGLAKQAKLDGKDVEARFAGADKLRVEALAEKAKLRMAEEAETLRRSLDLGRARFKPKEAKADAAAKSATAADAAPEAKKVEVEAPEAGGQALVTLKPEAEEEPGAEGWGRRGVGFGRAGPSGLLLNPETPMDNAATITSACVWHERDRQMKLRYWSRRYWHWKDEGCWREADEDSVRSAMWHELNAADRMFKHHRVRFEPKSKDVNATLDALKAIINVPAAFGMPGWFGGGRPEGDLAELVACTNGILHVPTRMLLRHTPKFWSPNVLEFGFEPGARAPRFERFLEEIWPKDPETQQCFLEMVGLCITDITKYHKIWMFVGPTRGGRGTIGRVLRGLIGRENYLGTSFKNFSETFGMESFIAKKVAVFSDANIDGLSRKEMGRIVELIKSLTGEDAQNFNRKYLRYWEGDLTTRLIIFANELLVFEDQSGALSDRFIVFKMEQQFLEGKGQDPNLTAKLLAERPGILNLALDALANLKTRDRLIQPHSGVALAEDLREGTSIVGAFVTECCDVGPDHESMLQDIFDDWKVYCALHGISFGWGSATFSRKLRAAVPKVNSGRPRETKTRLTKLYGIRLRKMTFRTE